MKQPEVDRIKQLLSFEEENIKMEDELEKSHSADLEFMQLKQRGNCSRWHELIIQHAC